MEGCVPSQSSAAGARLMSNPSAFSPLDIVAISDWTALGPCGPTWDAPAMQGTPVSRKHTVPPSWSVPARSGCAITPRTDWISWRIAAASRAFWLIGTTIRPPNWCRRQSSRTAGVSGPLKPTIITAPISCWRVIPPGPRIASWLLPAASAFGDDLLSTVGIGVIEGAFATTRDPQLASTRAEIAKTTRPMSAGSVPGPGVTRQRIKEKPRRRKRRTTNGTQARSRGDSRRSADVRRGQRGFRRQPAWHGPTKPVLPRRGLLPGQPLNRRRPYGAPVRPLSGAPSRLAELPAPAILEQPQADRGEQHRPDR